MTVLDASAAAELILHSVRGADVAQHLRGQRLDVPCHFDVEVVGVIRRSVQRGLLNDREGLLAVEDLRSLRIKRWPTELLVERAYDLRATHSVADAAYVALAEALDSTLVTCDGRLARSHGHHADIELIA